MNLASFFSLQTFVTVILAVIAVTYLMKWMAPKSATPSPTPAQPAA